MNMRKMISQVRRLGISNQPIVPKSKEIYVKSITANLDRLIITTQLHQVVHLQRETGLLYFHNVVEQLRERLEAEIMEILVNLIQFALNLVIR